MRKEEIARKDIYDVWFPNLAPSEALLKTFAPADDAGWRRFKRRYLAEMKGAPQRRDVDLLAALSHQTNFSVGCYCEDEARCHRAMGGRLTTAEAREHEPCDRDERMISGCS